MTITIETGEAEAAKFHAAFAAGFAANNHAETLAGMLAEKVDVEWSDGFVGEKTPSEIFEQFGRSWGFMVSNFLWSPDTIVDTSNDKIIMYGRLIINIDGKLGSPNLIDNKLSFVLKYDSAGKICQWTGYWDNTYAPMLEALGKVSAALECQVSRPRAFCIRSAASPLKSRITLFHKESLKSSLFVIKSFTFQSYERTYTPRLE